MIELTDKQFVQLMEETKDYVGQVRPFADNPYTPKLPRESYDFDYEDYCSRCDGCGRKYSLRALLIESLIAFWRK